MRYPTLIARIFIIPIERRDDTRIGNQESLVEYIRIRIKVLSAISERKMITKLLPTEGINSAILYYLLLCSNIFILVSYLYQGYFPIINDLIINNVNGFLTEDNKDDFASKLEELIINVELRKKFGLTARTLMKNYSEEKVVNMWKDVISDII